MNLIEIIILAIALGMDCLVVSFSQGLIFTENRIKIALYLACTMGLFQGLMPIISYFCTDFVSEFVQPYAKIIVFAIFMFLGLKFIVEAFQKKEEKICCVHLKCIIGLGVATSIDALASGVNLNLTNSLILQASIIIGFMSFIMSLFGFNSAKILKHVSEKFLFILGGLILVVLAFKACPIGLYF